MKVERTGIHPEAVTVDSGGVVRLAAGMVIAALLIAGLYYGRDILIPLVLAILLGFVLDPIVVRLVRLRLPRILAVGLVVSLTLGGLLLIGGFLTTQVRALASELPTYRLTIQTKLQTLRADLQSPGIIEDSMRFFEGIRRDIESATERQSRPEASSASGRIGAPGAAAPPKSSSGAAATAPGPDRVVQVAPASASPLEQAAGWAAAIAMPLLNVGIVLVFVVLVLLDRRDLRDRLLGLIGGNLHSATDALDEAGGRISSYLTMHLMVNVLFGLPLALGLWLIGVPGALLWGALATALRFVPYLGPMIASVFPLALAFAVDPGWDMLLWTILLIGFLELVSNNFFEPWLYGSSTGLSTIAVIVAATFWTVLWGPVGLVLSTPLTACALVVGRYLPPLRFLTVLLGSQPVLDPPTRVYQRLLAGDTDEAIDLSIAEIEAGDVRDFHERISLPVLRMATLDHGRNSSAEHHLRVIAGMAELLDEVRALNPPPDALPARGPRVVCLGARWEVDVLGATMLAHALGLSGLAAQANAGTAMDQEAIARLDPAQVDIVCLSIFSPEPRAVTRVALRRLQRRLPGCRIVVAAWQGGVDVVAADGRLVRQPADGRQEAPLVGALGRQSQFITVAEVIVEVRRLAGYPGDGIVPPADIENDEARVAALQASGLVDPDCVELLDQAAKRAADSFDMPFAMVSLLDADHQIVAGHAGRWVRETSDGQRLDQRGTRLPRSESITAHVVADDEAMVVNDVTRDLRFAGSTRLQAMRVRFFAAAPLRDRKGSVLGALCLLDDEPRELVERDLKLLGTMADELMVAVREQVAVGADTVGKATQTRGATDGAA